MIVPASKLRDERAIAITLRTHFSSDVYNEMCERLTGGAVTFEWVSAEL
jgi:hypothetical protein